MEKLIKLIDEYELKGRNWKGGSWIESDKDVFLKQENIIGKRYGFIKWLVDNDKIDMKKHFYDKMNCVGYSDLNIVLCELAISDTPIEDLISYLK